MRKTLCRLAAAAWLFSAAMPCAWGATGIAQLRVQNSVEPLAVEHAHPLFSWLMQSDEAGQYQQAYRIRVVRETDRRTMWDTERVESRQSVGIAYMGVALQPETAYEWQVEVWDGEGRAHTAQSRFETGLMSPKQTAWDGAQWIGSKEVALDAASHHYFQIDTSVRMLKGRKASLVFGADDFRMNHAFQNPDNLQGENWFRVELDWSGVGASQGAVLRVYRKGYAPGDREDKPLVTISAKDYPKTNINKLITADNWHQAHRLTMDVETSNISFLIDSQPLLTDSTSRPQRRGSGFAVGSTNLKVSRASRFNIGPWGNSHDYNTAPHLASVGFAALPGCETEYRDYRICNSGQSIDNVAFNASHYGIFSSMPHVSVQGDTITVGDPGTRMAMAWADPSHGALTMLRTQFSTLPGKDIAAAKAYTTAMGSYELFFNGRRMGNDWFAPGDSQYRETMGYHAHDVTDLLVSGDNAIGAQLSPGWYVGYMTFTTSNYNFFGDHEALLLKLVITYTDGTKQTVVSHPDTWKAFNDGPVRAGSFFHGERYDARKEQAVAGWSNAGYDDSRWDAAQVIERRPWVDFDFMARLDNPVQVRETLTARRVTPTHSADGHTYVYDMGVNMVGVPQITIPEGWLKEGDQVVVRYAEQLYPGFKGDDPYYVKTYGPRGKNIAGRPLYETLRAALCTDFYTAAGGGQVVIRPTTTYRGYQYVQITLPGHQGPLPLECVQGLVLSSDQLPTGTYEAHTADQDRTARLVNQLFKNIQRSQLGNFFTIPTDCPQRNERMGWTGDAQAYTRTATYNSDVQNFFHQWMVALRADQGVGSATEAPGGIGSTVPTYNQQDDPTFADGTTWAAAVCMVPWQLWRQYGDTRIIEDNIEAMMAWLNGMDFYDYSPQYPHLSAKASGLADWLAMDPNTPSDLVNNAIYIHMMRITAQMALAIGRSDYAGILQRRSELALEEWNRCYVDPATGKTRKGDKIIHSQASYATPLQFNCFNAENLPRAQAHLAALAVNPSESGDGSMTFPPHTITTGFSGTPNILPALSRSGHHAQAYDMFTCTRLTSWLYPVTRGATSVWERWNGFEVAFGAKKQNNMNSFNHFALGAVGQWMYEYQLGITTHPDGAGGYQRFVLQPQAGGNYRSLKGSYRSNYGDITSRWEADGKGHITLYEATVPPNTEATLYLPMQAGDYGDAAGARFVGVTRHNGAECAQYALQPGRFTFRLDGGRVRVE